MRASVLAARLVSVVTPLLLSGAEKVKEKASEAGWRERVEIWEKVKLQMDDNELATQFENDPESKTIQEKVTARLESKVAFSSDSVTELKRLLQDLPHQIQKNLASDPEVMRNLQYEIQHGLRRM